MSDALESQKEHSQHGEEHAAPSREALYRKLGEQLRHARQHRDISLEEAVHSLKLRRVYVEALENGEWENLPGEVYAIGFLRQYSSFLDLDLDAEIRQLKSGDYELTRPETFPDPPIAPKKSWVIVALLVLLVLVVIVNIFSGDKEATSPAPLPPATVSPEQTTPESQQETVPGISSTSTAEQATVADETAAPENTESTPAPEIASLHTYRFEAIDADAWIQLYTIGDSPQLVREALLHAGETLTVTHPDAVLSLTCGNPPALAIYVDGKLAVAAGRLGDTPGKVIRDYRLNFAAD